MGDKLLILWHYIVLLCIFNLPVEHFSAEIPKWSAAMLFAAGVMYNFDGSDFFSCFLMAMNLAPSRSFQQPRTMAKMKDSWLCILCRFSGSVVLWWSIKDLFVLRLPPEPGHIPELLLDTAVPLSEEAPEGPATPQPQDLPEDPADSHSQPGESTRPVMTLNLGWPTMICILYLCWRPSFLLLPVCHVLLISRILNLCHSTFV